MASSIIGLEPNEQQAAAHLDRHSPHSPFNSGPYAAALADVGYEPLVLLHEEDGAVRNACLGVLNPGSSRTKLEIPSIPRLQDAGRFWAGLREFCRTRRIPELQVNSFASPGIELPPFDNQLDHRERTEYVVDLAINIDDALSSGHRKNLKRAVKAEIRIEKSSDPDSCAELLDMMHESARRRSARGETVDLPDNSFFYRALVVRRAGVIYRAFLDEEVVSAMLVLRSDRAAYYHSAGSNPAGMKFGASPYLIYEVIRQLQNEGVQSFNLGGAGSDGLRKFKRGFGAEPVELQSARFALAPAWQRKLMRFTYLARTAPARLRRRLQR